jgi:hypothetical protein
LPSPQLLPTPLPSPPTFSGGLPRRRLHILSQPNPPPIPPRLIGSPLLNKTLNTSQSYERIDEKAKATLWVDGDEFGSNRSENRSDDQQCKPLSSPSLPPTIPTPNKRITRRPSPVHTINSYHSPPPSPSITSPPPPVPPLPAFVLHADHKKPVLHAPPPLPVWPAKIIPDVRPCAAERYALRRKRGLSTPHPRAAGLTCSQFMAMHNEPRRLGGIAAV